MPLSVPRRTLLVWLSIFLITSPNTIDVNAGSSDPDKKPVRNLILIIGDGMDDQQITIARNYLKGARGRLTLDEMPVRGSVQVLTVDEADPSRPLYVAESAGSGTAISTGIVTSRARIATSAKFDKDLQTIVELAQQAGLKTGLVTTSSVTDATPATFASHIRHRFCEDPSLMDFLKRGKRIDCSVDLKANGGQGSVAEQLATSGLDVLLGGGLSRFLKPAEGGADSVLRLAEKTGFTIVQSKKQLIDADPGKRILGLFADIHLPTRLRGEDGRLAEPPQFDAEKRKVTLPAVMVCEDNPQYQSTPSIQLMTRKALENLTHENDAGFFLMIESASIDKQAHVRNPCGSIGELAQLDETLKYVLSFADSHPDTLVLVTADHGQAAQIISDGSLFTGVGLAISTPGRLARIRMPQGGVMAVNYATNSFVAEEHTGVAVPLYANDLGKGLFKPLIFQPEIFGIMRDFLEL